jgi:hypothetical protein
MDLAASHRYRRNALAGLVLLAMLSVLCACNDDATPAAAAPRPAVSISAATLLSGQPVPAPKERTVLIMGGKVGQRNYKKTLRWDLATLDRLGLFQVTVYEPWQKKDISYRGVWLADLLKVAQVGPNPAISMSALDDYKVQLTAKEIQTGGIMLATQMGDGKEIPIEAGGPTRIIFIDGTASGKNPDQWIWSLKTLQVT